MALISRDLKKLVLFGAGKIGRSFIGQLFSLGGWEVVFIDTYKPIIEELNRRRNYNVIIKGETTEILNIKNVRGVYTGNTEWVVNEVASADILAVSVGQGGLAGTIPLIARGLLQRFQSNPDQPLDIIIAENLRNASEYLHGELQKLLPSDFPIKKLVGLVETSIGKMVPIMQEKDMEEDALQVFAEPYNSLILDKLAFRNPIPEIPGLSPKENMKAWVDRKLFIHNLGHATAAYLGYLHDPGFAYLYEVLSVPELHKQVRDTMLQAADILLKKYPDEFTPETLTDHIDDLLYRFQNKALGDTVYRVGCDLWRKLSLEDRLTGAIKLARELNQPYDRILHSLVAACYFRGTDENGRLFSGDVEFDEEFKNGITHILKVVCGFDERKDGRIFAEAEEIQNQIQQKCGAVTKGRGQKAEGKN